jgi:hypothetical protein
MAHSVRAEFTPTEGLIGPMIQKTLTTAAFALSLSLTAFTAAHAAPAAPLAAFAAAPDVILVEGGCGPGWYRGERGRCRPIRPYFVAPPVVVVPPVVCGGGFRWHPRFRRCVVL